MDFLGVLVNVVLESDDEVDMAKKKKQFLRSAYKIIIWVNQLWLKGYFNTTEFTIIFKFNNHIFFRILFCSNLFWIKKYESIVVTLWEYYMLIYRKRNIPTLTVMGYDSRWKERSGYFQIPFPPPTKRVIFTKRIFY